ncbi:MAG TPA: ABC transporter permease [Aquificae bacterium]|nr:ABC transporter permease [Aquificota bacterium]
MIFEDIGKFSLFLFEVLFSKFKLKHFFRDFFNYIILSTPLVIISTMSVGAVLALEGYITLKPFGATDYISAGVTLSLFRELGAVMVNFLLTARSVSALASKIATLKVTERLDALEMLAINPVSFLATPAVYAFILGSLLLTIIGNTFGILGSILTCKYVFFLNSEVQYKYIYQVVNYKDLIHGLIKSLFFGLFISAFACYFGFKSDFGSEGVGKAVTKAVTYSTIFILISDYFLTNILHSLGL